MKTPIFVRELTEAERDRLKTGLRAKDGFEVRRSQIVLASERKETARKIGRTLGCDDQTVRNVIKQFNATGLGVLKIGSRRPHNIISTFSEEKIEQLKDILHQSPRNFGKETKKLVIHQIADYQQRPKHGDRNLFSQVKSTPKPASENKKFQSAVLPGRFSYQIEENKA
jgi:hypothetical protein